MKLTPQDLDRLKTERGGFLGANVAALGENMQVKGWLRRLVGKEVPDAVYADCLARLAVGRTKGVRFGEAKGQGVFKLQ